MQKTRYFKCPHCGEKYQSLQRWGNHISSKHPDLIPEGWSFGRYFYYIQTGKKQGSCVMCKNPTEWNEATLKYERFCRNPRCKEQYREMFRNRMIGKYGKVHLLDDPEQQRKMLANKHISGQYTFLDGTKVTYTGTYELDFLRFLDHFLHFNGTDIMMPSPHTYYYEYRNANDPEHEGRHFYVPDAFIPSLNLEIEIKQNTNMHPKLLAIDKVKEVQKDAMMKERTDVHYLKITEKNYVEFIQYLENAELELPAQESTIEVDDFDDCLEEFLGEIHKGFSDYDFDAEASAMEAAGYSKTNRNPVFVVLTSGNTVLANVIRKSTGDEFSHSSISFNINLDPLYSFGSKKITPKHEMGFIKTSTKSDLWYADRKPVPYSIYVTFVSDENLAKMQRRLEYFVNNSAKMHYSFAGLFRVFFKLKSPKKKHWFCSAFVAEILGAGKELQKDSTLYRPQTLTGVSDMELLCSGSNIIDYDPKVAQKELQKIMANDPAMEAGLVRYRDSYVNDPKAYRSIRDFRFTPITSMLLQIYKRDYKSLGRVRCHHDSFGELVTDGDKVVGYYNTEKKDNIVWLKSFEICKGYRGKGLSPQLLQRAIKKGKVTNVAINSKNELALKIYLDYGFIEYARDGQIVFLRMK